MSALQRLRCRGTVTIVATTDEISVRFVALSSIRTIDAADIREHCHLGPRDWSSTGDDLASLLDECEEATRPPLHDVDTLRWIIERRRDTRTAGPPLPCYRRWDGWHAGHERWLRTFSHAHEYLAGYLRDLAEEAQFESERSRSRVRQLVTGGSR